MLKMALIIDGHRGFFEALGGFLRVGPPKRYVTFVKGNHDLNLHWSGVQSMIRDALGANSGRHTLVSFEERRIVREGIYVEHGNQYAEAVDRVKDMEEPHDHKDPLQLDLPRILIPPPKRHFWSVDWQARYVFEFLLPPPEVLFEQRSRRARLVAEREHEADALPVEPEVLGARIGDDHFGDARRELANRERIFIDTTGEALVGHIDKWQEPALDNDIDDRAPVVVRRVEA